MKKYLLFIISMLCTSIGAWADLGVTYDTSSTTLTVTFNSNDDIKTDAANYEYNVTKASWWSGDYSATTRVVFQMGEGVTAINDNILYLFSEQMTNVRTFDFSNLTSTQVGYITSGSNNFKSAVTNVVKNVIVPSGVTITAVDNNFEVSGGTVTATRFTQPDNVDWTTLARYGTTLKLTGTISSALNLGNVTGFTTIDLTEATVSANISLNEDVVTTVNVFSSDAKSYIKKKDGTTAFDDSKINVPFISTLNVTGGSVQSEIEAYIANYSPSKTIADITGLNISGTLSSADVTYLSSLTGLETLNLTGLTTFGSGVSKSTIETSVGNGVTITYPNFFVDNNSTTGVITFTVLNAGSVTSAALTDKGLNFNNTQATIKVVGDVTASDITNIVALSLSSWNTRRLDFSEANIAGAMPRISGSTDPNDPYYIILPAGYASPTDVDVAYTNDNAHSTTNGIYNGYDDLQYIIIPAAEANGHAKIFVNKTKNGQAPVAAALQQYDIDLITANNPSVIDVYNLDGAFGDASFSTLRNAIDGLVASGEAWEGKSIVYHATMNPMVITGCNVTIDMNEANGKSLATLISEAKTEVVKTIPTGICSLTINGPLASADIAALNTAMGTGKELASIESLNLGGATGMEQTDVDALEIPANLTRLTIPADRIVDGNLKTKLATQTFDGLTYVYSPSSDSQKPGPDQESLFDRKKNLVADYVWVNRQNALPTAFTNEEQLRNSYNIKVASSVELTATDVDFNALDDNKPSNYLFLNFSDANLTPAVAASYKVTDDLGYRIILPNDWTGDQMAVFAANPNCGKLAAVYSYNGTKLNIMEIKDEAYSPAALADPRIMRSGTTEVDVVSGYYDGTTYAQFGTNLLAALNNMGKSEFDYNSSHYTNNVGQSVKTISIKTTSAAPYVLTFDNPSITTLNAENLVQNSAGLNVSACSALTSLSVKGSNLNSVTASGNTSITSADLSGTAIATTTNFNGATALATFTTTSESIFNGIVDLTSSNLSAFTSEARFGGNINFNASSSLASIDLSGATFSNNSSVIHVDAETSEGEAIINGLKKTAGIKVPSSFANNVATRVHPYNESYVSVSASTAAEYNEEASDMTFHDKATGDNYRYWYQGTSDNDGIVTIGTSSERRISNIITKHGTLSSDTHAKIKVVGPLTSADITSLQDLNCTALDLSEATYGGSTEGETIGDLLKASFSDTNTLGVHSNVKFIALPDSCTRDYILNEKALAGLKNSVYCVIAVNETSDGKDLTSYSFQSGSLQPAVVAFQNSAANSWNKILSSETTPTTKYTSTVSNFKKLKISGLINSYDLSKADQKLDADGHLSWAEDVVESTAQTRTLNGDYNVYGPFSSCYLLTEIDLRDAYFEPKSGQSVDASSVYYRYWYSDMTLSFLNVISTATYKVVIPQNSKVREIPADFMRCSTNIRAICIPSNIQAIRTRAFYTIDYVWTTADAYATTTSTADPEGNNTKLDNGAKLSNGTQVYAMKYDTGKLKYEENPEFLNSYYTADYSGVDGGGTYTFGSTLKLIETGAFANTQPNVSDVYVLNTTAPECHVDAFNTVMYTGNGGYNSAKVSSEGIITRDAYYNGRWITMLHYPRQTTDPQIQRYTDPTRDYSIATGMRDGKGAILYFPNQSEFIRAYQQGTYGYTWNAWNPTRTYGSVDNGTLTDCTAGWTATDQSTANALFDAYTTGGTNHQYTSFYKVSDFTGENVTAPKTTLVPYYQVNWDGSTYSTKTSGNLYPQSEIDGNSDADGSGEKTTKDYRGWHQFVLNAYAANTVLEEEPYRSYITDNAWWTICPEFNITKKEAIILFGTPEGYAGATKDKLPYVSKLRYVRRMYGENGNNSIFLNFSDNLMEKKEKRTSATDQHGELDGNGVMMTDGATGDDDVVMSAGVPYMIKPNLTLAAGSYNRQFRVLTSTDYAKLTEAQKQSSSPRYICDDNLYEKIQLAQNMSGANQIALVKNGTYTVPVFVGGRDIAKAKGYTVEDVEMKSSEEAQTYKVGEVEGYNKSTDWHYTFVGTFYKSFLPHYSYFLGWDSSNNCAKFYYHNGNFDVIDNQMRWANGTGIIVPVKSTDLENGKFKYSVSVATDMKTPAQWDLKTTFGDDSFKAAGNAPSPRMFSMDFNSPDVTSTNNGTTMIEGINVNEDAYGATGNVYSLEGRKVGNSLLGLPKGVYIMNGKKYIVK